MHLVAHSSPELVPQFLGEQLPRTSHLMKDSFAADEPLIKLIPAETHPSPGKIRVSPLTSLMYERNLGGSIRMQQFLFCFKPTGVLSQQRTFPLSEKRDHRHHIATSPLALSSSERFRKRPQRSGFKDDNAL